LGSNKKKRFGEGAGSKAECLGRTKKKKAALGWVRQGRNCRKLAIATRLKGKHVGHTPSRDQ